MSYNHPQSLHIYFTDYIIMWHTGWIQKGISNCKNTPSKKNDYPGSYFHNSIMLKRNFRTSDWKLNEILRQVLPWQHYSDVMTQVFS